MVLFFGIGQSELFLLFQFGFKWPLEFIALQSYEFRTKTWHPGVTKLNDVVACTEVTFTLGTFGIDVGLVFDISEYIMWLVCCGIA